ncbi:sulfite exporter TauE/SafE family protein [Nocardioides sp. YIM 152315]|uniref:sulfite exporter TauE/SafE family protein n=1 Tax=Nocardioides sp. YIM 152315 TaxID=3031760 RepID=UPI0023DA0335|nr:sulfite exporter TauE/SafE family protein [Nocardioides sp. YIM 152315]MDF1606302.1 sulfite exporter TauE/SafE family protein [Nocardioides sp. YIM 152315]
MGGLDPGVFALVFAAVLIGSTVQSVVGLGVGLVAAPVITLVEPDLMPGVMLALAFVLPCVTLVHDHDDIDWRGLGWSLPARVVGSAVGVWVVATFSADQLGAFIGTIVLLAAALTWHAVTVPITRSTLGTAGFVSGVTGTATSIGGPPFALLYQHRPPTQIRTTMAVYFVVGAALSLAGLTMSGDLELHQVAVATLLLPALGLGVLAGVPLRRRVPAERVRPAVLLVSAASAVVLVVRSLV